MPLKQKKCKRCGMVFSRKGSYCEICVKYRQRHPEGNYPTPPRGEIYIVPNGDIVCHICGGAYKKLGTHIKKFHHMEVNEYKDRFQLAHNSTICNVEYSLCMAKLNKEYININQKNLLTGMNTRYKDAHEVISSKGWLPIYSNITK